MSAFENPRTKSQALEAVAEGGALLVRNANGEGDAALATALEKAAQHSALHTPDNNADGTESLHAVDQTGQAHNEHENLMVYQKLDLSRSDGTKIPIMAQGVQTLNLDGEVVVLIVSDTTAAPLTRAGIEEGIRAGRDGSKSYAQHPVDRSRLRSAVKKGWTTRVTITEYDGKNAAGREWRMDKGNVYLQEHHERGQKEIFLCVAEDKSADPAIKLNLVHCNMERKWAAAGSQETTEDEGRNTVMRQTEWYLEIWRAPSLSEATQHESSVKILMGVGEDGKKRSEQWYCAMEIEAARARLSTSEEE
jgi:hypothetical protein